MPNSAGPTHPMVSVPSSMIASRLLAPICVATLRGARGVGQQPAQGVGVGRNCPRVLASDLQEQLENCSRICFPIPAVCAKLASEPIEKVSVRNATEADYYCAGRNQTGVG